MISIENVSVVGWEAAIRGMRNPMNSWEKSDSVFLSSRCCDEKEDFDLARICHGRAPILKNNDLNLMRRLRNAGTDHRKFMRMITVYVDITAPLYWWKEFDTYKVGTVANSCSTMHKIADKEFTLDNFSHEHLKPPSLELLKQTVEMLNDWRDHYLVNSNIKKDYWWQMIQLLPSSYNQRRTVMLNYEVLANIYHARRNHKLDEWVCFCGWIENLPYAKELIVEDECKKEQSNE